jgi:hypothetical protein
MRAMLVSFLSVTTLLIARPQDEVTRDFQKTVAVKLGQRIEIEHRLGSVNIRAGSGSEASIRATIRASAGSRDEAQQLANQVEILIDDRSAALVVRTRYPEENRSRRNVSYSASYDITIPGSSPLVLRNKFGAVDIEGMQARVEVYGGHGTLNFRNGRGDHYLENQFGAVDVRGNQGSVNISNNNGSVRLADISGMAEVKNRFGGITASRIGGEMRISGGHGGIQIDEVGGPLTVHNVFSGVEVTRAKADVAIDNQNGKVIVRDVGGAANIKTTFGSIDATHVRRGAVLNARNSGIQGSDIGGGVNASTTFGAITLTNVTGRVDATAQNSSITMAIGKGCDPVAAHTTFGSVRITVPADGNYDVSAVTTFGHVQSDLPMTVSGNLSGKSVQGKIGKGGCRLDLESRNGSIQIRR